MKTEHISVRVPQYIARGLDHTSSNKSALIRRALEEYLHAESPEAMRDEAEDLEDRASSLRENAEQLRTIADEQDARANKIESRAESLRTRIEDKEDSDRLSLEEAVTIVVNWINEEDSHTAVPEHTLVRKASKQAGVSPDTVLKEVTERSDVSSEDVRRGGVDR